MEPLIISLLQQMMYPPFILFKKPETPQMPAHPTDHPRHPRDRLQKNTPRRPLILSHPILIIPCHLIKEEPDPNDGFLRESVLPGHGWFVGLADLFEGLWVVDEVRGAH